eukprot:m.152440 g.152440  ORF g.152440 m.152440 type:complete len:103 (+) comp38589_c0_seq6:208-516(+)
MLWQVKVRVPYDVTEEMPLTIGCSNIWIGKCVDVLFSKKGKSSVEIFHTGILPRELVTIAYPIDDPGAFFLVERLTESQPTDFNAISRWAFTLHMQLLTLYT